ncbi:MAG: sigma-54-dependent Fis family transcriptional regulator [Syntrophaceae bacterium]|nr:sigma-54-dependent Fis family transcriptional regulator [Syntrophaceae bacterium]
MGKAVLIVDDDELMLSFLSTVLRGDGFRVEEARSGQEGLARFLKSDFDLALTDLRMPDFSGVDLIRKGREAKPEVPWVIITAFGSIDNAVTAMKAGASDYLTKPLSSPDELRRVVRRILAESEKERKLALMSEELASHYPPADLIFLGEKMEAVRRLVREVAPTTATVLVTGPSGTGKELVARFIHQSSPRREKPFVAVHCAALTETLLESELFGHEKGAYTGAAGMRKGRFELADGGTLFLDEIGEISPSIQVKLLRAIQERVFERVGGMQPISVDVRIIASTNRDLREETAAGRFREDLFYRLNVFPVTLPPLRDRKETILPLAEYFTGKFSAQFGKKISGIREEAQSLLLSYPWPGNIRELQNIIERAVILAADRIGVEHLNLEARRPADSGDGLLKAGEEEMIRKVLAETGGSRKETARILGISLRTLQYRIKEYGIR